MKDKVVKIRKRSTFAVFFAVILFLSVLISSGFVGIIPVANALGAVVVSGINMPADVAVLDGAGWFYVVETGTSLVKGFDNNNELVWSRDATSPYIATGNGNVYVSNPTTGMVNVLNSATGAVSESHYVGSGGFVPRDIAIHPLGLIYVVGHITAPANSFVRIFNPDWSSYGTLNFTLATADHIDIDDTGNVFITYAGTTNQVHVFPSGGGPPILFSSTAGGSFNPRGIGVDGSYVYVVDQENNRVQKFTTSGTFLGVWGSLGSNAGQFDNPIGLAADSGRIYVGDWDNDRIQIFQSANSTSVSVTPNPVLPNYNLHITGQVTPAAIYPLEIFATDPNGNYVTIGTWMTDGNGGIDFWWFDAPPPVYGLWSLEVKDISDPYNAITLATTDFEVVELSAYVSVTPNPAHPGDLIQISGALSVPIPYDVKICVVRPDGTAEAFGPLDAPDGLFGFISSILAPYVGMYYVNVSRYYYPDVLLGETTYVVLEAGACGLVVHNNATGDATPTSNWSYLLMQYEDVVHDFTLDAVGGDTATFAALAPGPYWLAQTRKFNYATTTTVNGVEVPATELGNTTYLNLDLTADTTTHVWFNNSAIPEGAFGKPAPSEGSSSQPAANTYNMPCLRAVPVQVSWDPDIEPYGELDLVKNRPTRIMVNFASLLTNSNPLGVPLAPADIVTVSLTCEPLGLFNMLSAVRTGADISSNSVTIFNVNPPSATGSYTITCTTELSNGELISESYTTVKVRETAPLSLYYSHAYRHNANGVNIDYGTEPSTAFGTMVTNTGDFVKAVYPVPGVTIFSNTTGFEGAAYTGGTVGMFKDCLRVEQEAKLYFADSPYVIGVAIGPDLASGGAYKNYFKYHGAVSGNKVAVGVSFGPAVKGVVVSEGYYSTAAHEIAHTFNLYYGVPEQYTQYTPGAPANGFWVEGNQWRSGYDFMGLSPLRSTTSTWVSTENTFEPIFNATKTTLDPQIILVNGIIYDDGTVELPSDWYYLPYGTPDTVPTGDFAIRFTLASGTTIETSFAAQFFMNLDPGIEVGEDLQQDYTGFGTIPINFAAFAFATEYPEGTTNIELLDNRTGIEQVIETIQMENVVSALSAGFGGFVAPVKEGASFRQGTVVPVKFQLVTEGVYLHTAQPTLMLSFEGTGPEIAAVSFSQSTTGNMFRYDFDKNQYVFNLETRTLQKGTWQLRVYLGDGTAQTVNIKLR